MTAAQDTVDTPDLDSGLGLDRPLPGVAVAVAGLAVFLLASLPFWFVEHVPLLDYPFHLARAHIVRALPDSPILQQFYAMGSFLLPNVGLDVLLLGLLPLFPTAVAGRIAVALALALILGGTVALHYAVHRRWTPWPLAAGLFLFNWIFFLGYLNYVLGVGLMLWALALWLLGREGPTGARLAVATAAALVLMFTHLVAFGLYAVSVAAFELQRAAALRREAPGRAVRDLVLGALPFLPALLVFALASPTAAEHDAPILYRSFVEWKLGSILRTLSARNPVLDVVTVAVLAVAAVLVLRHGRVHLARSMIGVLAALTVTFLVMPYGLFTSLYADGRMPMAILFIGIAGTQPVFVRSVWSRAATALLVGLLAARSVVFTADWIGFDRVLGEFTAAFAPLEAGSTIVVATGPTPATTLWNSYGTYRPPLPHVAALAVLDRPLFAPTVWAVPAQQAIHVTPRVARFYAFQNHDPIPVATPDALSRLAGQARTLWAETGATTPAYLLLIHPDALPDASPAGATPVGAGSRFRLWRLDPPR